MAGSLCDNPCGGVGMKRNENRYWYDKGYSDGVKSTQKDAKIPKVIGVSCLSALLYFDQYWILAFVIIWIAFELEKKYDLEKWHEAEPPERWKND